MMGAGILVGKFELNLRIPIWPLLKLDFIPKSYFSKDRQTGNETVKGWLERNDKDFMKQ